MKYNKNMSDLQYFQYKLFKSLRVKDDIFSINCEIEWKETDKIE